MRLVGIFVLGLIHVPVHAQWKIQQSHTTASLRAVHAVSETVAWASGANGTVLRTKDGGANWQGCAIPKGAENLDLVSIQGLDEKTALTVSTGKGKLSSVFETEDGCQTWRLVFANPDFGGSFTSIRRVTDRQVYLLGDPVDGKFSMFYSADGGKTWNGAGDPGLESGKADITSPPGNGSFISVGPFLFFGARSSTSLYLYNTYPDCDAATQKVSGCPVAWARTDVPLAPSPAAFFFAARTQLNTASGSLQTILVAVGSSGGSAAISMDGGKSWKAAPIPPSASVRAIAYSSSTHSWIAVGLQGTEFSVDDGQKWQPMSSTRIGVLNAAHSWSALSLPFAVGDGGSIGRLDPGMSAR